MNPLRRRRLGALPFSPLQITGLKAWYKADSLGLADGTGIAAWLDSSGNGNTLTQSTGANQPLYKVGIQNGMPVARFNGTSQSIQSAAFGVALAQPTTWFAVASEANTTAAYVIFDGLTASLRQSANYAIGGTINLFGGAGFAGGSALAGMNIITVVFGGASSFFSVNGAGGASGNAGAFSLDGITLGQAYNATAKLPGDIAEVLLYAGSLTAGDRSRVQRYLGGRYGIGTI